MSLRLEAKRKMAERPLMKQSALNCHWILPGLKGAMVRKCNLDQTDTVKTCQLFYGEETSLNRVVF